MLKTLLRTAFVAGIALGIGFAQQQTPKLHIPVTRIPAENGKQMFVSYCAPCHGADARGNGPLAGRLKVRPADLTVLSKNNHAEYPGAHVVTVLNFGASKPIHGTGKMPVWGLALGRVNGPTNSSTQEEKMLRISNLARYVETLQVK